VTCAPFRCSLHAISHATADSACGAAFAGWGAAAERLAGEGWGAAAERLAGEGRGVHVSRALYLPLPLRSGVDVAAGLHFLLLLTSASHFAHDAGNLLVLLTVLVTRSCGCRRARRSRQCFLTCQSLLTRRRWRRRVSTSRRTCARTTRHGARWRRVGASITFGVMSLSVGRRAST
jgi:hypothetical protein